MAWRRFLGLLTCAGLGAVAWSVLAACADGTTPDCSGNPSPCGYDQPATGGDDASSDLGEGGG
ncbi:MAG TPA: hypothetical protein VN894_09930 [Polyangiaceae bacterium]|nr:hypothetical protein [Polyangiaceae bacterium]